MATSTRRDLFIAVSGNIDKLDAAMKAGRSVMRDFGNTAVDVQAEVNKALANFGGEKLDATLKSMDASFNRTFNAIRANARAAATSGNPLDAVKIFDAAAAEQAAAAAEKQALALRLVATATNEVARAGGDNQRLKNQLAASAELNARQAEQEAQALRSQALVLREVNQELARSGGAANQFVDASKRVAAVTGAQRAGMQQLSFQLNDVAVQFAAGTPPAIIFAQQIGQVSQAIGLMSTKTTGFVGFLGGPWGLALSSALVVLTPFVSKLFESGDAAEGAKNKKLDLVDALDKQKIGTEAARKAIADYNAEQDSARKKDSLAAAEVLKLAKARLTEALARREQIKAALEEATQRANDPTLAGEGGFNPGAAEGLRFGRAQQANDDAIKGLEQLIRNTQIDLAGEAAKAAADPIVAVNQQYDRMADAARRAARGNNELAASLTGTLSAIEKQRKAALAAEQKRQQDARSSANDNRQSGREITLAEAERIVRGIGGRVSSGRRSREEQEVLYQRYLAGKGPLAAKPGTSDHERGQAVDIPKTPGITLARVRRAFEAQGVRLTQLLDEGGHIHAAFGKRGPSAESIERKEEELARKRLDADQAFAQAKLRAQEEQFELLRRQTSSISESATLDVQAVRAEQERLDRIAQDRADETKAFDDKAQARADELKALNKANADLKVAEIKRREAVALIDQKLDLDRAELDAKLRLLDLEADLATTAAERRRVALQILEAQEREREATLKAAIAKEQNPARKEALQRDLDQLPQERDRRRRGVLSRTAGPVERLAEQLDPELINERIEQIKVDGLQSLEDGLVGVITGTESVASAFKKMAASIIADLVRIAIQQTIVKAIGTAVGLPGFSNGGLVDVPGFAAGGLIRGRGTGKSDSILSFLSNGEFVMNAASTQRFLPLLQAMNDNRIPGFADGGLVGLSGTLRLPGVPRVQGRERVLRVEVDRSDLFDVRVRDISRSEAEPIAARYSQTAVIGGAGLARQQAVKAGRRKLGR